MAEYEEQPETQEEIVRRVVSEFVKTHSHRDWGPMDCRTLLTFAHQADAVLNQANPTSALLYTILATTSNVRIISIVASVTWTVQPTLEIVVTIDGVPISYGIAAPVSTTRYGAAPDEGDTALLQVLGGLNAYAPYRAFLLEGRSVLIQARRTGGTASNLSARVKWARRT